MDSNNTHGWYQNYTASNANYAASTAMARGGSGDSMCSDYTNYTDYSVSPPGSAYGVAESVYSPVSGSHHDALYSSHLGASYSFSPAISGADNDFSDRDGQETPWWEFYDFIATVDAGQQAYWRLKPQYTPSASYPSTRAVEDISSAVPRSHSTEGRFLCLETGCTSSFRRKADLQRHLQQMHTPVEQKTKFYCDWKRCARSTAPFHRLDHCRDHYREYHKEDMVRRGGAHKEDSSWWASRNINDEWWRCTRCLDRVDINEYRFECPNCKISCEPNRQDFRSHY
ncbi:hypothetical protein F5Y19DRAFT_470907 [Xylariaceae sp. FL1651]|nr:hypothetical protein F5Y19DRAFT_470907 [Xylariaceae sp. FL1651]